MDQPISQYDVSNFMFISRVDKKMNLYSYHSDNQNSVRDSAWCFPLSF